MALISSAISSEKTHFANQKSILLACTTSPFTDKFLATAETFVSLETFSIKKVSILNIRTYLWSRNK
ncbi:MAG: hypothetical protein MUC81_03275 [Bacteroidia bacterium]|jgi:hypothetical protein|nr:hypothetical protein [Bacteroidia bacterium]